MLRDVLRRIEARRDLVLDMLRVYLGAGLFFRGLALLLTDEGLRRLAGGIAAEGQFSVIAAYVITAHIVGGALMALGLYTRWAALVQLPVLAGAVFLVHWREGLLSANQSFEFSALVLFLLLIVCVFGSGRWSLDARWRNRVPPVLDHPEQPSA